MQGIWRKGKRTGRNSSPVSHPSVALIAVVLFLFFDFTALALNVWLSYRIETQAVYINLAGRQRMLSQRIVKSLLVVQDTLREGRDAGAPLTELREAFILFDNTLQGFAEGGSSRDGQGVAVRLEPLSGQSALLVDKTREIWAPYRQAVQEVINRNAEPLPLARAVAVARDLNLDLLALMNRLTTELEQMTQREASHIRFFQGLAFLLALINFAVALAIYVHRIRRARWEIDLIDSVINRISSGILVVNDASVILRANHAIEAMFGYSAQEVVGLPVDRLLHDGVGIRRDGQTFDCVVEVSPTSYDGQAVDILTLADVTEQRRTVSELSTLAYHDHLTGLPNRLLFDDRLTLELNHCLRRHTKLAVLFIDLDEFKPINDAYGHEIGDLVLRQVASRLSLGLRSSDTVSRRGGDEFTVILVDIASREDSEELARGLQRSLSDPYYVNELRLDIKVSIGIAIYPDNGEVAEQLIRHADEAMYQAKGEGAGGVRCWGSSVSLQ